MPCHVDHMNHALFKGSPDPSHVIFEINLGKRRIRLFPTLILNIKWLGSELSLTKFYICHGIDKAFKKNILSKFRISDEPVDVEQLMENVQFVPAAGLGYAQR